MSIKALVEQVRTIALSASARGSKLLAVLVCPEGELLIARGLMSENCEDSKYLPDIRLAGVQVRANKRMVRGRIFYLYQGGLK